MLNLSIYIMFMSKKKNVKQQQQDTYMLLCKNLLCISYFTILYDPLYLLMSTNIMYNKYQKQQEVLLLLVYYYLDCGSTLLGSFTHAGSIHSYCQPIFLKYETTSEPTCCYFNFDRISNSNHVLKLEENNTQSISWLKVV